MQPILRQEEQTAERKLQAASVAIMRDPKFRALGGVMMMGALQISDACKTAYTNGRDEMYGRGFVDKLRRKELAFVRLHETMHKALRHLTTYRKLFDIDGQVTNHACDYVINGILVKMDPNETVIAMPRDENGQLIGLYDPRFDGMSEKQVFDILMQEKEEDGGGGGDEEGFDEHDWEGASDIPEEEQKKLGEEIERTLRQGLMAGNAAGDLERLFGELLAPKVDWREVLREFIQSVCTGMDDSSWNRVNKRFVGDDIYFPSMISESVGEIVVGGDMSGSCTHYITPFLSEIKAIADEVHPEKLHLMYWDTAVAGHEEYDASNMDSLVQSTKPRGGGGTDPRCVMNYINNHNIKPQCIIILTDGEVGNAWGNDWNAPVLWVVVGNRKIVAPVGTTIYMEG
jgi:predicted metal-dependent peptidase